MEISRAATGLLAAICATVGAGGTYLIVRGSGETAQPAEVAARIRLQQRSSSPKACSRKCRNQCRWCRGQPPHQGRPAPPRVAKPTAAAPRPNPKVTAPAPEPPAPARRVAGDRPRTVDSESQASRPIEPPAPVEELVVAAQSVIGLQMETSVTSERASRTRSSPVDAVVIGDRVVIPAGARAQGVVTLVERGGRVRERARLGVRFTSIVLADGTFRFRPRPCCAKAIPLDASAAEIGGGAIGGAIIGGILGGAKARRWQHRRRGRGTAVATDGPSPRLLGASRSAGRAGRHHRRTMEPVVHASRLSLQFLLRVQFQFWSVRRSVSREAGPSRRCKIRGRRLHIRTTACCHRSRGSYRDTRIGSGQEGGDAGHPQLLARGCDRGLRRCRRSHRDVGSEEEGFVSVINLRLASEQGADIDAGRAAAQSAGQASTCRSTWRCRTPRWWMRFWRQLPTRATSRSSFTAGRRIASSVWMIKRALQDGWPIERARRRAKPSGCRTRR